jgi:GntR family phosphonate transport system transcriptional regulator
MIFIERNTVGVDGCPFTGYTVSTTRDTEEWGMVRNFSPLWRLVRDELAEEIRRGRLAPGDLLPTEQQLGERFAVHRHTIRRALQELREMGLVRTAQGRGSVVLEQPLDHKRPRRTRFSQELGLGGLDVRFHFLHGDLMHASDVVAEHLGLRPNARISYIESLGEVQGRRLFIVSHFLPLAGMEDLIGQYRRTGSLGACLRGYGVRETVRVSSRISTRMASDEETRHLRHGQKRPLLVVEYVNADSNGRPVEFNIARFCGDKMELVVPGMEPGTPRDQRGS